MATCSKKYLDLVVTATSGHTPENVYGLFGTPYDYSEWRELAFRLVVKVRKHLDRLQATDKTPEQTEESNALVEEYNGLVDATDGLPGVLVGSFSGAQIEQSIGQAVGVSVDSVCLMERIDEQLRQLGKNPPGEPPTRKPGTKPIDTSALLNVALIAGVGYLGYRVVKGAGGL